jgi:pimeloyl-ACP methyl ester carboxylesterase
MTQLEHKFVETNGIKMHFVQAGSGPLVILCHGWPESWYSWRHQITALAEAGFQVVAPDQRGYGQTDAPSTDRVIQYSQSDRRHCWAGKFSRRDRTHNRWP